MPHTTQTEKRVTETFTVQIEHISFARNDERGEDGAVWYLILSPCPDDPCTHVCRIHPRMKHQYERQAFRLGDFGHRLNASAEDIAANRANVWGWDGNLEAPTLTPSYLAHEEREYRMHSFLRAGQLDLCGDSTVVLANPAVPCLMALAEETKND